MKRGQSLKGEGRGGAVGVHAHRRGVDHQRGVGVKIKQVIVVALAAARDHLSRGACLFKGGHDRLRSATAAKYQGFLATQKLAGGFGVVLLAKTVEHPGKAHDVGILCIDGAVGALDQGVRDSELGYTLALGVGQAGGVRLVRDGDVQSLPNSLQDEVLYLIGLKLNQLVGGRAHLGVELRRPTVAKLAANQAKGSIDLLSHGANPLYNFGVAAKVAQLLTGVAQR